MIRKTKVISSSQKTLAEAHYVNDKIKKSLRLIILFQRNIFFVSLFFTCQIIRIIPVVITYIPVLVKVIFRSI